VNSFFTNIIAVYWVVLTLKSTVFSAIPGVQGMYSPMYPFLALGALRGLTSRSSWSRVIMFCYGTFLALSLLALLLNQTSGSMQIARRLGTYAFGAIAFLNLTNPAQRRGLVFAQVGSAFCVALWVIYTSWTTNSGYRGGITINWNYVSFVIAIGALPVLQFCYANLGRLYKPRYALMVAVLGAQLYSLSLLASRGQVLALAGAIPCLALGMSRKRVMHTIAALICLGAIAAGVLSLPGSENLLARAQDRVEDLNLRVPIWQAMLTQYRQGSAAQMIAGQGIDAGEPLVDATVTGLGTFHNSFLQVLFEEGLAGIAAFLALHAWPALLLWKKRRVPAARVPLAILVFMVIGSLSGSSDQLFEYWIALAAVSTAACLRPSSLRRESGCEAASRTRIYGKPLYSNV